LSYNKIVLNDRGLFYLTQAAECCFGQECDALHFRLVQAVQFVRILRLLLAYAIGACQQCDKVIVDDFCFAMDVTNQPTHVSAQFTQLPTHALVLFGMRVTTRFDRRFLEQSDTPA